MSNLDPVLSTLESKIIKRHYLEAEKVKLHQCYMNCGTTLEAETKEQANCRPLSSIKERQLETEKVKLL